MSKLSLSFLQIKMFVLNICSILMPLYMYETMQQINLIKRQLVNMYK